MDNSDNVGGALFVGLCAGAVVMLLSHALPAWLGLSMPDAACAGDCLGRQQLTAYNSQAVAAWVGSLLSFLAFTVAAGAFVYSRRQLVLAREAYTAEHRAWVKIETISLHSGLQWTPEDGRIEVIVGLRNIGKTLATNIWIDVDFRPATTAAGGFYTLNDVPVPDGRNPWGSSLFPNDTTSQQHQVGISRAALLELGRAYGRAAEADWYMAGLYVRVGYRLIDGSHRYTMQHVEIGRPPRRAMSGPSDGDLALDDMNLRVPISPNIRAT